MSDDRITYRIRGRNYRRYLGRRPSIAPTVVLGILILAAVLIR